MDVKRFLEGLRAQVRNISTGEKCERHGIHKLDMEGETVCPRCETEKYTAAVEEEQTDSIIRSLSLKAYNTLDSKSVVSDRTILDATFGNFTTPTPLEESVKAQAVDLYKEIKSGAKVTGMLVGDVGTGKSHIAMALLRNLNEIEPKDKTSLFVSVERMFQLIRASYRDNESPYTEQYFIDLLSSVDYLALDDLGAEVGAIDTSEKASNFVHRVLYSITNARMDKTTIITTNLSGRDLEEVYDRKTVSRLSRGLRVIDFAGVEDKRPTW